MTFTLIKKEEALASYHALDPQLTCCFYDSDSECAESVATAGPPPPEPEEEILLKNVSPEVRQELEGELAYEQMHGQSYEASVDTLTPVQSAIQKIGKAARQQQAEQAGRVSGFWLAKASEELHRLIGIDSNGDLLDKRVSGAIDVDVAEFLHTFEDPDSDAGKLVDRLIEEDCPMVSRFLRAVATEHRNEIVNTAEQILSKR
jgi:hypothetical protein